MKNQIQKKKKKKPEQTERVSAQNINIPAGLRIRERKGGIKTGIKLRTLVHTLKERERKRERGEERVYITVKTTGDLYTQYLQCK